MKTFLKVFGVFVLILGVFSALAYLVYKNLPQLKEKVISKMAENPKLNMEQAYSRFLESCENAAKEKTRQKGMLTPELDAKFHNYCLCAQEEFKKKFNAKEIISIGLNKMMAQNPNIDQKKIEDIFQSCKSNLL